MDKIWNYIKLHYSGIFRSISVICTIILLIILFNRKPTIPLATQHTIDSLKVANTELITKIELANTKIAKSNTKVDSLLILINTSKQDINNLSLKYDKKINSISGYDTSDITKYFLNRYGSSLPPTK